MSVKNYRFVSPGVFVNEIDNSQLPASPAGIGPVIIGRAEKGPALRPITVNSFEEFVNIFGTPAPGNDGEDIWRQGNSTTATTYGMYAAQAYLRNSSPLTFVRLLGAESNNAAANGEAGWQAGGDAYGVFLFNTNTPAAGVTGSLSGALAAVIYTAEDYVVELSGTVLAATASDGAFENGDIVSGSDYVIVEANSNFTALIKSGSTEEKVTFNFTETDARYIRKVLNTNPQRLNSGITTDTKNYFLGETFDGHINNILNSSATTYAAVARIYHDTSYLGEDFRQPVRAARTPQVISCRLAPTEAPLNLFQFIARGEGGDWTNKNIKISIQDIKQSTNTDTDYGTFSVVIRHISDSDNVVRVVEQFNNCTLNPNSLDYVARKIGDYREVWSESERRYVQEGNYQNNSQYVYISMNSDVDAGVTDAALLPFGFQGIVKYEDEVDLSGSTGNWVTGSLGASRLSNYTDSPFVISGSSVTASVAYPRPTLRLSASNGNLTNPTDAYFGLQTTPSAASTRYEKSTIDLLRPRGGIIDIEGASTAAATVLSPTFTLDDIASGSSAEGVYVTGSHAGVIAGAPAGSYTFANGAIAGVLGAGYDRFTVPLFGGFDGTDILEMDPFANRTMSSTASDTNSYEFFSIRRAIDSVADPEVVEMNLAAVPGLTQDGLTTHLVRTCEDRADALAVIDLPGAFTPREESTAINRNNTSANITTLVNGLRDRGLNSSYGCAYYPWVRARDTINGAFLWLPPSVAAIGTFSSSQRRTQVWFAPAGFNRGGLTEGSAGIPVVDVAHQLRRKDRDDLYTANINPIAKFPAEGVVIFGQKTLQVTPSALDRINVRRLMIFVKKRISQIASGLLFDPNVQQTWKRFTAQVNPFLADVKTNFGLSDYRVVLDDTTTTPDLVDRNILYAQIYLKPTRAIEFIAIDFNITRTGASFDD